MPDIINTAIEKQLYSASFNGNLLAKVDKVIVCFAPGSMLAAGFSDAGALLTARYYRHTARNWALDFYEQQFNSEPLLSNTGKIAGVFISSPKNIIVPNVLYKEKVAEEWLSQLHFVEKDEAVYEYALRDDKAHYLYTVPAIMKDMLGRRLPKARPMPFAAHQFNKGYKTAHIMQCTVTDDEAYLTCYRAKHLQWHKVFSFDTGEDIAYYIKLYCREHDIQGHLSLICADSNPGVNPVISELAAYFPDLQIGMGQTRVEDEQWKGAAYLLQQLYTCVS